MSFVLTSALRFITMLFMKWAQVEAVEEAVESWSDAYLQCRSWGHRWYDLDAVESQADRIFLITQRCKRCRAERRNEMDYRGFVTPWVYVYNKNYLVKNLGRIDAQGRARVRLGAIRNMSFRIINRRAREAA